MISRLQAARLAGSPRVYDRGRALVADVELSAGSHPHLADHMRDGALVFPAALALEAMAQAAAPLSTAPDRRVPVFENAEFHRPIVVPADGSATIRIAARSDADRVEVVIRGSGTGFRTDHVQATLRHTAIRPQGPRIRRPVGHGTRVPLDPATDLAGDLSSRSSRILAYRKLAARSCIAEISAVTGDRRCGPFLAAEPVLGDPSIRHAFLDAIQNCVPEARLVPVAVDRIYPAGSFDTELVVLSATERHRHGDTHVYDLDVHDPDGMLLERWQGLRLVAGRDEGDAGPWVPALLGPYLERHLESLVPGKPRCVVEPDTGDRDSRRVQLTAAVRRMLGRPALIWHREDGNPEIAEEGIFISAAHSAGVMVAMASTSQIGCGAKAVHERPYEDWRALLSQDQFDLAELIGRDRSEPLSVAATRVWGAADCLRKAGRAGTAPLTLGWSRSDGWVRFVAGQARITTFPARLRDVTHPVVFSILTEGRGHGPVLRVPARR